MDKNKQLIPDSILCNENNYCSTICPESQSLELDPFITNMVALFDFTGELEGELSFFSGEELHLVLVDYPDDIPALSWCLAENKKGKRGYVPGNYFQFYL